jgi:glycosyltransferase involved in cell wall biosynthesis
VAGVEVWLRGESNDLSPQPVWKQVAKRMQLGWLFSRVDRFLYVGPGNRRLYKRYGVGEPRLYPAPYAVDNERFAAQASALRPLRAELRRQWGIPDDAFCILFCGKFIAKKRPMDLVLAARRLMSQNFTRKIHLLFAGSGASGEEIRRECRVVYDAEAPLRAEPEAGALPPAPPASFAGFLNQTEVSRAYVAADCLVLPSDHRETWGLVVNEALASGLACLVSDACGCAEELTGKSGSFQLGNVDELAAKLASMACAPPKPVRQPPSFSESSAAVVSAYRDSQLRLDADPGQAFARLS